MTSPSSPIDSSVVPGSPDIMYVLEADGIWKTTNLKTAGAATWTKIWESADYYGNTFGALMRIKAPEANLVYAIGWGQDVLGLNKPFCLRSSDGGVSWAQNTIDDTELVELDYTMTYRASQFEYDGGGSDYFGVSHTRIGDDESTYNPWAMAWRKYVTEVPPDNLWVDLDQGIGNTIHAFNDDWTGWNDNHVRAGYNKDLSAGEQATASGWLDDYFGSWEHVTNLSMPKESNRINMGIKLQHGDAGDIVVFESWVFWHKSSPIMPKAFDVAPSNHNWLYVGLESKIVKSEDGGFSWTTLTELHGANDICVDPQAAGAIYYWSTEGLLNLMVAGVITSVSLLTETPLDQFGRLARAPDSGMLWAIPNGTTLKRRNLGSWADQKTGLYGGCGLQAYAGQKLIFLDALNIYISDDSGTTITAKTGSWTTYANPKNAHRLEA